MPRSDRSPRWIAQFTARGEVVVEKLGHTTIVASDGLEALQALESHTFDLVLMDVQMPEMDGLTATGVIRKREADTAAPRLPVIALTAHAMAEDRGRCLAAGMDDYLTKPVRPNDLARILTRFFGSPAPLLARPSPPSADAAAVSANGSVGLLREPA